MTLWSWYDYSLPSTEGKFWFRDDRWLAYAQMAPKWRVVAQSKSKCTALNQHFWLQPSISCHILLYVKPLFNPHKKPRNQVLVLFISHCILFPFYKWDHWDTRNLINTPQNMQWTSREAALGTRYSKTEPASQFTGTYTSPLPPKGSPVCSFLSYSIFLLTLC